MFVFGHVGIGRTLARRWIAGLRVVPLTVGMLLPDIIDKPLYYARISPFISCTRTFGHSGLLLFLLACAAYAFRSRVLTALAIGVATHLLLDCSIDWPRDGHPASTWVALTWPLDGGHFATYEIPSVSSHLALLWAWPVICGEAVGLGLIGLELWRHRLRSR